MIELDVKGYCRNCPDFEAHVEKLYCDDRAIITTITCEYAKRCEHIKKYIGAFEKGLKDPEDCLTRTGINIRDMGSNGVKENEKRNTVRKD